VTVFIDVTAWRQQQDEGPSPVVIDVRSADEYAAGHIPGALHIPASEIEERLDEFPRDRLIVPY
jgi:rhodanese-related sulfurtransferase